jgi:putative membrane protein
MMAPYIAFLHHLAAFALVASLAVEFVLLKSELTLGNARLLQVADRVYGAAAGLVLIVGFVRVFYFEKGSDYYFHSAPFMLKLSAFIVVGVISIFPTREFLSWSKPLNAGQLPVVSAVKMRRLRMLVHVQLAGAAIVILGAALMAKGIGYLG